MLGLMIAAAVAAQAPQDGQSEANCAFPNLNPATLEHLVLSPTDGVPVPRHPGGEEQAFRITANTGKALGYTRIRAAYFPCGTRARRYQEERRSGLKRFFLGKNAEKLLKLGLLLKPGDVKFEAPLTSLVRHSNKQGEDWSTSIHNDRILTPYFRVDLGSTVTLDIGVKSTRDYDATIGADMLDLINQASALIAPTTPLITAENKGRFNAAAAYLDKAIDGLLKVAIEEKALSDVQLSPGPAGAVLAVLTVNLPMANNTFANAAFPNRPLGQWVIYAERLRESMMGDVREGRVVRSTTSPAAILGYLVGEKKTLREALAGSKGVIAARDALVSENGTDVENKARILCRVIVAEAERLELAPADVGASAWAYLTDLALPRKKMGAAEPGCAEVELYPA